MSTANQGSDESGVESETRVSSDSTIVVISDSEKSVEVTLGSACEVTDDDLLRRSEDEEDVYPECSSHTIVGDTLSDRDEEFDPDLPTR